VVRAACGSGRLIYLIQRGVARINRPLPQAVLTLDSVVNGCYCCSAGRQTNNALRRKSAKPWLTHSCEWLGEPPETALEVFEETETRSIISHNDSPDVALIIQ